jgi:hypothetical protein
MKYLEEIKNGDCFIHDNFVYLLTSDFKKDGSKLSYRLDNGFPQWFNNTVIVEDIQIYRMDKQNNIIPIKETTKNDANLL